MIKYATIGFAGYTAAVLASSDFSEFGGGILICWLLLAAAFSAWSLSSTAAMLWGGLLGLMWDVAGTGELGPGVAIVGTLTGAVSCLVQHRQFRSAAVFGLLTAILVGASVALRDVSQGLLTQSPLVADDLVTRALIAAAATGFIGWVALGAFRITPAVRLLERTT